MMSFDYSNLIGRIIAKFKTRKAFAKAVGFSENTISKKLNGKMNITKNDIIRMSAPDMLDIPAEKVHEYFFKI